MYKRGFPYNTYLVCNKLLFLLLLSHVNASIGLFWLLLGLVEEDKISVEDPAFSLTATFGRLFLMAYVVCTVIVALNMLIAMMNNSFDRIMVSVLKWTLSDPCNN